MKILVTMLMLFASNAHAVRYYQTIPGTNAQDLSAPGFVVDDNRAYYTLPSSNARDLTRGGYIREGNTWIPTLPSSNARDWSEPAISSDPDSIVNSQNW